MEHNKTSVKFNQFLGGQKIAQWIAKSLVAQWHNLVSFIRTGVQICLLPLVVTIQLSKNCIVKEMHSIIIRLTHLEFDMAEVVSFMMFYEQRLGTKYKRSLNDGSTELDKSNSNLI